MGVDDPDNPEWTEHDFARARPAYQVHARGVLAQLIGGDEHSLVAYAVRGQQGLARGLRLTA